MILNLFLAIFAFAAILALVIKFLPSQEEDENK